MNAFLKNVISTVLICAFAAAFGLWAAHAYTGSKSGHIQGDYSVHYAEVGQPVILLGTDWCGYCRKTREHLAEKGIAFADLDIENSELAARWHAELGAKGVPVMLIGNRQIRGYDPKEMDAALAELKPDLQAGVAH